MKKVNVVITGVLLLAMMLCGCGRESDTLKDMKVEKYVKLGEYKAIPVSVEAASVDDEEWNSLMNQVYMEYLTEADGITDRAVKDGDTANIDYEGKKDGVAFEGGTAQGYNLGIGSGSFIPGFEDGLVGVMPGETVDLNLTFPTTYDNTELAGQEVVFTVKVNYILDLAMKDEVIRSMEIEGVSNVSEFRQYIYDYLYSNEQANYENLLKNTVLRNFMDGCTFSEVPEGLVEKYREITRSSLESQASMYGMDVETLVYYSYGTDLETFLEDYCTEAAKQDVALQAVANCESLNINDEELDAKLLEYANNSGVDTIEEFIGETDKEEYRDYFMHERVLDYLVQNAIVTEE